MQQSHQRVFSIEEANNIVPFLSSAFNEIFKLNESARSIGIDISDLVGIWGDEVMAPGHVDNMIYIERIENRKNTHRKMQEMFEQISETGAVVKDIDTGLVDFYAKKGDELVMLCWKFGEDQIKFWHPISSGFSKRKPISELKR